MTINYKEHVEDLENGRKQIQKIIDNPKTLEQQKRAKDACYIQETRIQYLKIGYNLRNKEIKEQKTLNWGQE